MVLPMTSTVALRTDSPTFHLRWRGYDRAEVDAFLEQTAADRRRLQEDLTQLEAVMSSHGGQYRREFERLAALRREVEVCLEASTDALRQAADVLASTGQPHQELVPDGPHLTPAPLARRAEWMTVGRLRAGAVAGVALGVAAFGYLYQAPSPEIRPLDAAARLGLSPAAAPPVVDLPQRAAASPEPAGASTGAGLQQVEGLVLTLTARGACWIRTIVDGGQPLERLLNPRETITLRANDEAVLRIGDAGALSLLINNQPARSLGAPGQAVTAQITRANYLHLLRDNDDAGGPVTPSR